MLFFPEVYQYPIQNVNVFIFQKKTANRQTHRQNDYHTLLATLPYYILYKYAIISLYILGQGIGWDSEIDNH